MIFSAFLRLFLGGGRTSELAATPSGTWRFPVQERGRSGPIGCVYFEARRLGEKSLEAPASPSPKTKSETAQYAQRERRAGDARPARVRAPHLRRERPYHTAAHILPPGAGVLSGLKIGCSNPALLGGSRIRASRKVSATTGGRSRHCAATASTFCMNAGSRCRRRRDTACRRSASCSGGRTLSSKSKISTTKTSKITATATFTAAGNNFPGVPPLDTSLRGEVHASTVAICATL
ncbi:hypothetical protein B0H14DRAFT_1395310 [Mycena olivaceomarginata]|nr:hypothetical protein B0H14DRAFT_1395310 [Mycena olivaceomarginata]